MTQELKAPDFAGRFLPPGEVIADRFEVGEKIGEGPFGQVYLADDNLIEAEVALKVFDPEVTKTPVDEEKFVKAARRARALTQENVVRLHDGGVHRDHPWVSMQHLEGLNLRKVVGLRRKRGESFGLVELEPLVSKITLALQHVGRDYPHGNLKPENVILMPDLLKVTDSYLLSALPRSVFARRNSDNPFVAPELQTEEQREPDSRCDVYSLGALIGFMLFGEEYQPGSEAGAPGGLSAVDALCRKAMAFDPTERYGSVEELAEDYTSIVDTGSLLSGTTSDSDHTVESREGARRDLPEGESSMEVMELHPDDVEFEEKGVRRDLPESESSMEVVELHPDDVQLEEESAPDPLDVETAPDIGMPLEDDLSTEEYDRETHSPELADLLPTNEVDREKFPSPEAQRREAEERRRASVDRRASRKLEKTPTTSASKKSAAPPKKGRGCMVIGLLVGIIVTMVAVAGAAILALDIVSSDEEVSEATEVIAAAADDDGDEEREEEPRGSDGEGDEDLEQRRKLVSEVASLASQSTVDATGKAKEAASEKASELEEQEEEVAADDEPEPVQTVAAAGRSSRESGARPDTEDTSPATDCPSAMVRVRVGGEYACVDAYQYPGRGRMPQVNVSWFDARRLCGQRDKRLCTTQEWRAACGSTYPYGSTFDPDRCNTADADGFGRSLAQGGAFPQCRSSAGAYDMSGNAFEWVEEQRVVGGDFDSDADRATCSYSSAMAPGSSRGNVGFRCCADPQ